MYRSRQARRRPTSYMTVSADDADHITGDNPTAGDALDGDESAAPAPQTDGDAAVNKAASATADAAKGYFSAGQSFMKTAKLPGIQRSLSLVFASTVASILISSKFFSNAGMPLAMISGAVSAVLMWLTHTVWPKVMLWEA